jgi:hypothetical protein
VSQLQKINPISRPRSTRLACTDSPESAPGETKI